MQLYKPHINCIPRQTEWTKKENVLHYPRPLGGGVGYKHQQGKYMKNEKHFKNVQPITNQHIFPKDLMLHCFA